MEEKPMAPKVKNKWKVIGIILIILSLILSAASTFFILKSIDQKSRIDELNNRIKQLEKNENTDKTDDASDDDDMIGNVSMSYRDISVENSGYAEILSELEDAFSGNEGGLSGDIRIYDSPIDDYQVASISVSYGYIGAIAKFWRKDENSKWAFFEVFQNSGPCEMYNTDDIRRAFAGFECYDENKGAGTYVRYYFDLF